MVGRRYIKQALCCSCWSSHCFAPTITTCTTATGTTSSNNRNVSVITTSSNIRNVTVILMIEIVIGV